MNSATNPHPSAGQGNGSVDTQCQPAWSSLPSSVQSPSSARNSGVSKTTLPVSGSSTFPRLASADWSPADTFRGVARLAGGLSPELHVQGHSLPARRLAAVDDERHRVAGLPGGDDVPQARERAHGLAVDAGDHVAADDVGLA